MRLSFVAIVTRARKRAAADYHGRVVLNNDRPLSEPHPVAASGISPDFSIAWVRIIAAHKRPAAWTC
jgi:hypothetical protein